MSAAEQVTEQVTGLPAGLNTGLATGPVEPLPGQRAELFALPETTSAAPPVAVPAFAEGGDDPYRRHLHDPRPRRLELRRSAPPADPAAGPVADEPSGDPAHDPDAGPVATWRLDVLQAPADLADQHAIADVEGPLLDIGCGPGRMLDAAVRSGVEALGIDVAHEAAAASTARGARAVVRSVFEAVPGEGTWRTALLMDGNLGIGGDPDALLARCAALLGPGGVVVVEADADATADERGWYVLAESGGGTSAPFPWARLGHAALLAALDRAGFTTTETRTSRGRRFVHATRPG